MASRGDIAERVFAAQSCVEKGEALHDPPSLATSTLTYKCFEQVGWCPMFYPSWLCSMINRNRSIDRTFDWLVQRHHSVILPHDESAKQVAAASDNRSHVDD